jgi:CRP/FNR family transcriptional regulator, cyclic AMP receptor protein
VNRSIISIIAEQRVHWLGFAQPWLPGSFLAQMSLDEAEQMRQALPERLGSLDFKTWRRGNLDQNYSQRLALGPSRFVFLVLGGVVKVYQPRWDGLAGLAHVAGAGDILNAEAGLTGSAPATELEWGPTLHALVISRDDFGAVLDQPAVQRALACTMAWRVQSLTRQREHAGREIKHRLWAFLVDLARRHGIPDDDGRIVLGIRLSQADMATAIGASSNSVEAAIQQLKREGKLSTAYLKQILHQLPSDEELAKSLDRAS